VSCEGRSVNVTSVFVVMILAGRDGERRWWRSDSRESITGFNTRREYRRYERENWNREILDERSSTLYSLSPWAHGIQVSDN